MIENIFYLILAILGLGFLIFIHELGHLIVARKNGMTVEAFSIGFGRPLRVWEIRGVKWQLCILPFGGYVKIAGMEKRGVLEPHQIPDGFYGKGPWQRIQVAFAGPFVNIAFAFIAFVAIWIGGGQQQFFSQHTNVIGNINPESPLYQQGIRPGDVLTKLDERPLEGFPSLLMDLVLEDKKDNLHGFQLNYLKGEKKPFTFHLNPNLKGLDAFLSLGIGPAQYLFFDSFTAPGSPIENSGIQKNDRLIWVDGNLIFSRENLKQTLNEPITLLSVKREDRVFLARVPRLKISDIRWSPDQKLEIDDFKHAAGLDHKISQLYFIPYNLSATAIVEGPIAYIDKNADEKKPEDANFQSQEDRLLKAGDQIIAVDGTPVSSTPELLLQMQTRKALILVDRSSNEAKKILWTEADALFETSFPCQQIAEIEATIGTSSPLKDSKTLHLLSPVPLKPMSEIPFNSANQAYSKGFYDSQKKEIEKIENKEERALKLRQLDTLRNQLGLGVMLHDETVCYNPYPWTLFMDVLDQTWKTLTNLVSGSVSPKNLSGPVGIVQALQGSLASGVKSALFWLGFVSLNLAFLNLLPLPILDGGHILFALIEKVSGKPIKSKTMEKLVIPFVILLVGFFIYVTYQDLARLLHRFF